jgi:hypothetical protein
MAAFIAASTLLLLSGTLTAIVRLVAAAPAGAPLFLVAQAVQTGALVAAAMGIPALGLRGIWQGLLAFALAVGFSGAVLVVPLLYAAFPPVGGELFLAIFAPPFVAASIVFLVAVRDRPLPLRIAAGVLIVVYLFTLALLPLCPGQILSYPLPASFPPQFLVCLYYPLFALPAYGLFLFLFVLRPPPG